LDGASAIGIRGARDVDAAGSDGQRRIALTCLDGGAQAFAQNAYITNALDNTVR
jgi:hypothetical protein